jgi:hypothetical protein
VIFGADDEHQGLVDDIAYCNDYPNEAQWREDDVADSYDEDAE